MNISFQHLEEVCKIGQGKECCRYIGVSDSFECMKHSSLKNALDARVQSKTITARGDNCGGNESDIKPTEVKTIEVTPQTLA